MPNLQPETEMQDMQDIINRLKSMDRKMDHICNVIDGGDKPESGMIIRMDRLEQKQFEADRQRLEMTLEANRRSDRLWSVIIGIVVIVAASVIVSLIGIWLHFK